MLKGRKTFDERNLKFIKNYGSGSLGHPYHTWDEGDRDLFQCKKCGAYLLRQYSEVHMPDATYIDYFPVEDEADAEEVNRRYDGWSIETDYPYKGIFLTYHDD